MLIWCVYECLKQGEGAPDQDTEQEPKKARNGPEILGIYCVQYWEAKLMFWGKKMTIFLYNLMVEKQACWSSTAAARNT